MYTVDLEGEEKKSNDRRRRRVREDSSFRLGFPTGERKELVGRLEKKSVVAGCKEKAREPEKAKNVDNVGKNVKGALFAEGSKK